MKKNNYSNKKKGKIPFAIFIKPKKQDYKYEDYKNVFADIISDRIKKVLKK